MSTKTICDICEKEVRPDTSKPLTQIDINLKDVCVGCFLMVQTTVSKLLVR